MAWAQALILAASLIVAGALLVWVGLASRGGALRRNWVAGLRTPATLADDETWAVSQRAGWSWTTAAGVVSAAAGAAVLFRPSDAVGAAIVLGAAVIMLALAVIGGIKGHRAAQAVLSDRSSGRGA